MSAPPILDERRRRALGLTWRDDLRAWALRQWLSLAAPADDRVVPGTKVVAVVALVMGVLTSIWSISTGAALAYEDAQSHLTIARRVTDSLAPGFTQLGTVWLPVPSLMLLPMVQSTLLWHTGWSAALLGTIALIGISCGVYRILVRIGIGRSGRLVAVALIVFNPALLYECTTGMTEPALIMWIVACVAGMTRWTLSSRDLSAGELMIFAGLPAAAATLSRYEGWALVFAGTAVVALVSWRRRHSLKYAIKMGAAFALWPAMAIFWWMVYNFAVYGNPIEFVNGQYSAYALQKAQADAGLLAYQGNLGLSVWTFGWALLQTMGAVTIIMGLAGAVVLAWTRGIRNDALMIWMLTVPVLFSIFAMYAGQTAMFVDHGLPEGLWNSRYAISALPALAALAAVLLRSCLRVAILGRFAVLLFAVAIVVQSLWWVQDLRRNSSIAEAMQYISVKEVTGTTAAAVYMNEHYDGGRILMDEAAAGNAILPEIGIPLGEYYNRSTGDLFTQALAKPAEHARWVFMTVPNPDEQQTGNANLVYEALADDPAFNAQYKLVFNDGLYRIFRKIGA